MSESKDLSGRVAMVTGASSGIGKAAAEALARRGASVYVVCRDKQQAAIAAVEIAWKTNNPNVHGLYADLGEMAQVRALALRFLHSGSPLHLLINNAGSVFGATRQHSSAGVELTFALNHLSYFYLTQLLLDRLMQSAPARIVNVASAAYRMAKGPFDFADYNGERRYSAARQYGLSKLANILFTRELARRIDPQKITVNAALPGMTASNFGKNTGLLGKLLMTLTMPFSVTPAVSAELLIDLATSIDKTNVSGRCFTKNGIFELPEYLCSAADAKQLWALSETLIG